MLVRWGNPSPPNPPLEGEGFDRLFGYFVSVHAGARLSRNDDNPSCPSGDTRSRAIRSALATSMRSEEHTSELQSLMRISYAVFCLKKKTKKHKHEEQNKY